MNYKFLLGVAVGAGVAYFFTSKRGQELLESVGQKVSDSLNKGEDLLLDATEGLENVRQKVVSTTKQQPVW